METQHLITKKIDSNTNFVFLKRSKKFLIFDDLYIDLINQFYTFSKKNFKDYVLKKFPNSKPNKIYSDLKDLLKIEDIKFDKIEEKYIVTRNLNKFKFKLGDNYFCINYDDVKVVNTIIGQLFHLKKETNIKSINYYVFKLNGRYFLNDDYKIIGSWNEKEIHYLTGKLLSLIMCDFHKVKENKR